MSPRSISEVCTGPGSPYGIGNEKNVNEGEDSDDGRERAKGAGEVADFHREVEHALRLFLGVKMVELVEVKEGANGVEVSVGVEDFSSFDIFDELLAALGEDVSVSGHSGLTEWLEYASRNFPFHFAMSIHNLIPTMVRRPS